MITKRPKLQRKNPDSTILSPQNAASLNHWRTQSTYIILNSLKPGQVEPLTVDSTGKILQGNTRIFALQERYFDVDSIKEYVRKEGL